MGMLMVDVGVVLVFMCHGRMTMPMRVLGSHERAVGVLMSVMLIMVMLMAVLLRLVRMLMPMALG